MTITDKDIEEVILAAAVIQLALAAAVIQLMEIVTADTNVVERTAGDLDAATATLTCDEWDTVGHLLAHTVPRVEPLKERLRVHGIVTRLAASLTAHGYRAKVKRSVR